MPVKRKGGRASKERSSEPEPSPQPQSPSPSPADTNLFYSKAGPGEGQARREREAEREACGASRPWAGCCACSKSAKCLTSKVRERQLG
jgi:hypothetical protein